MLLRVACVYMVLGLVGGMFVALSGQFRFVSVHSHVSLLGWTTMALAGLVYLALPACARSGLARAHVWLHNLGLPIMLVALTVHAAGDDRAEPIIGLGSLIVLVGLVLFAANVFRNAASENA
jgi:cbb3-type cytochrome oxidase subunit 1